MKKQEPHKTAVAFISLLVVIVSADRMIRTWFLHDNIIAFLTSFGSLVTALAVVIRPDWLKAFLRHLLIFSISTLIISVMLLLYLKNEQKVFRITYPHANEKVRSYVQVSGVYRIIAPNQMIWILVQDKEGKFYLGDAVNAPKRGERNGTWDSVNVPVGSYADAGKPFDIWAILVEPNTAAEDTLLRYLRDVSLSWTRNLPSVLMSAKLSVIRQP